MAALGQVIHMNNTLFGCMDDCGDCVHAWCLPQCHLGSIAQNANSGDCFGTSFVGYMLPPLGCYQCYAKSILEKALQRVGVTQPIAFFEWYCCTACLQCQVSREVNDMQAAAAVAGPAGSQPQVTAVQAPQVNYMQAGATVTGPAGSQPQVIVVQAPPAQVLCSI